LSIEPLIRPRELGGELRGHQAGTDDADLGDLAGEALVGHADRALGPALHEVERVQAGPRLVGHEQVGERFGLLLEVRAVLGRGEQLDGFVGRRDRAV
jgi:hypothetical protein